MKVCLRSCGLKFIWVWTWPNALGDPEERVEPASSKSEPALQTSAPSSSRQLNAFRN